MPAAGRMSLWLKTTGTIYALGAVAFLLRPRAAPASLSRAAGGEALDDEPAGLYNTLAFAYMATIAALALGAAGSPEERKALIPPLLVAKASSSAALMWRFTQTRKRGFAVGAALDAFLLGVTAGFYSSLD
jgi:hypothetical protein